MEYSESDSISISISRSRLQNLLKKEYELALIRKREVDEEYERTKAKLERTKFLCGLKYSIEPNPVKPGYFNMIISTQTEDDSRSRIE